MLNKQLAHIFFVVCIFTIIFTSICMGATVNKYTKTSELQEKYLPLAREFVEKKRGWKESEYRLRFSGVILDKHVAIFRAEHIDDLIGIKIQMREENYTVIRENPNELGILIHTETLKAYEDRHDVYSPWNPHFKEEPEKTMTAPAQFISGCHSRIQCTLRKHAQYRERAFLLYTDYALLSGSARHANDVYAFSTRKRSRQARNPEGIPEKEISPSVP